jgi:hypothetical protein
MSALAQQYVSKSTRGDTGFDLSYIAVPDGDSGEAVCLVRPVTALQPECTQSVWAGSCTIAIVRFARSEAWAC